jgi:hypothetical protein
VQRVGLLLICLIVEPSMVMLNGRVSVGVKGGRIEYWHFVCHVQAANPSIVFTIEFIAFLVDWTGHNTLSVQLLGIVSLVQACWITACNAST